MKIKELVVLHHPHWDGSFLIKREKLKTFIERNFEVWEKTNIDPDLFISEDVYIKDAELQDVLFKEYPEWFL